ncbi:hypothetical protein SKAU_G00248150 [Synaphobranchus kaupii]|uniref:Uncharacterized protein n=1 Tax=Synaphobranchus kaupii TaxID=118154 RepID=A0A9Q1IRL4_SYNKA|nr:hypothetical protein SKAU_G00248150 [Synaphobranchus kaupii]
MAEWITTLSFYLGALGAVPGHIKAQHLETAQENICQKSRARGNCGAPFPVAQKAHRCFSPGAWKSFSRRGTSPVIVYHRLCSSARLTFSPPSAALLFL